MKSILMVTARINRYKISIREKLNPFLSPLRRIRGGGTNSISIVSNNCWGAHVYRYFGLPYSSPTIGLYFFADDYIRFLKNMDKYLEMELTFIDSSNSRHLKTLQERNQTEKPIGLIGDVEIVFLHYKNREEAKEKWDRRVKRLNKDNLIIKMSEQNDCTEEHLKEFDSLPYRTKFVFVSQDYGLKSQVIVKDYINSHEVYDDTTKFRKYINLYKLVKGRKDFRKK